MLNSNQKQEISRYDLKKELEGIQSFDISSFAQSKNQNTNNKGSFNGLHNHLIFPTVNAPTLELLEDSEYNIRYLDIGKQQKTKKSKYSQKDQTPHYNDLTARNSSINSPYQYQQKLQNLSKQLSRTLLKLQRQKKQNQLLHQKINVLERLSEDMKQKQKQQRDQIKYLKEREIKSSKEKELLQKQLYQYSFRNGHQQSTSKDSKTFQSNTSKANSLLTMSYTQDFSCFCPELLSPQQTVTLLSKLLKKVSKSNKMIKQLTQDQHVKVILNKIHKK